MIMQDPKSENGKKIIRYLVKELEAIDEIMPFLLSKTEGMTKADKFAESSFPYAIEQTVEILNELLID